MFKAAKESGGALSADSFADIFKGWLHEFREAVLKLAIQNFCKDDGPAAQKEVRQTPSKSLDELYALPRRCFAPPCPAFCMHRAQLSRRAPDGLPPARSGMFTRRCPLTPPQSGPHGSALPGWIFA